MPSEPRRMTMLAGVDDSNRRDFAAALIKGAAVALAFLEARPDPTPKSVTIHNPDARPSRGWRNFRSGDLLLNYSTDGRHATLFRDPR